MSTVGRTHLVGKLGRLEVPGGEWVDFQEEVVLGWWDVTGAKGESFRPEVLSIFPGPRRRPIGRQGSWGDVYMGKDQAGLRLCVLALQGSVSSLLEPVVINMDTPRPHDLSTSVWAGRLCGAALVPWEWSQAWLCTFGAGPGVAPQPGQR